MGIPPSQPKGLCPRCALDAALKLARPAEQEIPSQSAASPSRETLGASGAEVAGRDFGDYELHEEIARGGMGIVYRARQKSLDRIVALKTILSGTQASKELVRRLKSEGIATPACNTPISLRFAKLGFTRASTSGHGFCGWTHSQRSFAVSLVREACCDLCERIAEAIHAAHEGGVLHRDLKPSNVLVDVNDQPRDGLRAGVIPTGESSLTLSARCSVPVPACRPSRPARSATRSPAAANVYGLGAILYHLITGRPPFQGATIADTVHQVVNNEPAAPRLVNSDVPFDLETICLKCLEKEPARRYATAMEVANELGRFLNHEPIWARPVGRIERTVRWCRREPALAVSAGLALILLLVIAIGSPLITLRVTRQRERAEQNAERARLALTRVEIERAESMFAADSPARGIAYLAHLLRQAPTNRVVAERLLNALSARNFCLPSAPPLRHDGKINSAQFSPNGQWIVTASRDGTAQVWDSHTGQPVGEALRHTAEIKWAQFSPDGGRVVTASVDGTARVWNAQTGQPNGLSLRHDGAVLFADFSPDGRRVVTGSRDRTLRLWDSVTGEPLLPPIVNNAEVYFVRFSPNGIEMAAAIDNGTARIFSCSDGAEAASFPHSNQPQFPQFSPNGERFVTLQSGEAVIWNIRGKGAAVHLRHRHNPIAVAFSARGELVATASLDNTARIWNSRTGEPVSPVLKHDDEVSFVQFNAAGSRLLTGAADKSARVWEVRTGKPLTEPIQHGSRVRTAQFSPDGERVLTLANGNEAVVWRLCSNPMGSLVLKHGHDVRHAAFSADRQRVATASWDRTARVWDARTGLPLTKPLRQSGFVDIVRFSPDGLRLATVSDRLEAQIWDVATGDPLVKPKKRLTGYLWDLQFSPDGRCMAIGTGKGGWIWDAATGDDIGQFQITEDVRQLTFSPEGQRLVATTSPDGSVRIFDVGSGSLLTGPMLHDDKATYAEFSPDGERIITASRGRTARIWNARSGQMIAKPIMHADVMGAKHSVQFSPDGKRVVTAAGKSVQVWDAQTGEPLSPQLEHRGRVNSVRFSPDGRRLVTAIFGDDSRVWDAATGHALSEPLRHREGCHYAEFSPDGEFAVTASADGTAAIWWVAVPPTPSPTWLPDLAEALAGRKLDEAGNSEVVPVEKLFQLKQELSEGAGDDYYGGWAKWFLLNDPMRTPLPSRQSSSAERMTLLGQPFSPAKDFAQSNVVSCLLGGTENADGLELNEAESDGRSTIAMVGDVSCRLMNKRAIADYPGYFYFSLDPAFKRSGVRKVTIEVECFDVVFDGKPVTIGIDYDATGSLTRPSPEYAKSKETVRLKGSNTWRVARFQIDDAAFKNSQNGNSDFRIWGRPAKLYVRRVTVIRSSNPQ